MIITIIIYLIVASILFFIMKDDVAFDKKGWTIIALLWLPIFLLLAVFVTISYFFGDDESGPPEGWIG